MNAGRDITLPVVDEIAKCLEEHKLIIGTGGGARSRHVLSIAIDIGMRTGVLAKLAQADALGNAHILGTLLVPYGVVAIPPKVGSIPPHRTDAGSLLLSECFGCKRLTLVTDVDGLYDKDPNKNSGATFIDGISVPDIKKWI